MYGIILHMLFQAVNEQQTTTKVNQHL